MAGPAATSNPINLKGEQLTSIREASAGSTPLIYLNNHQISQAGLVDANAASRTARLSFLRGFLVGASAMLTGWFIQNWSASNPQNTTATAPARPGGMNPEELLGAQNWGSNTNSEFPPRPNVSDGYGEGDGLSNGRRAVEPADTDPDRTHIERGPDDDREDERKPAPRPIPEKIANDPQHPMPL
jgi:hypothetical protein